MRLVPRINFLRQQFINVYLRKQVFGLTRQNVPLSHTRLSSTSTSQFNFIANAAEKAAPAVVCIEVLGQQSFYHASQPIGSGSGFLVTDYGIILTNAHVVSQASQLNVKLRSNEVFRGDVIDADPIADLAVVKINAPSDRKFPTLNMGNSATIRPGEWVVALGSPLNLSNTVTAGIVSSVHRGGKDLGLRKGDMKYIQTDAAINRGNSGGPLINLDSDVIGINTMTLLNTTGISFAVPIDRAKAFLLKALEKQDLVKSGGKSSKSTYRPYIGLKMMSLTPDIEYQLRQQFMNFPKDLSYGVLVVDVMHDSPSYHSGLQPYDVIVEADNVLLSSSDNLSDFVARGREFDVTVIRGSTGKRVSLRIKPKMVATN